MIGLAPNNGYQSRNSFLLAKALIDKTVVFAYFAILPNKVESMENSKRYIAEQAKIFKALGHPSRLLMVEAMCNGEKCVCELRELVGDDMSTISKHLSILREAGVLSSEKRGTNIYYRLKLTCLANLLSCIEKVIELNVAEHKDILNKV